VLHFKGYIPPNKEIWKGRVDGGSSLRLHEVMQCVDITKEAIPHASERSFGLVGFASDEGIKRNLGRIGAHEGPQALRHSLASLPKPLACGAIYDCGDIACNDGDLESAQAQLGSIVHKLLKSNITSIVLGGGHETAWAHYQGIAEAFAEKKIGIFNFDAHFDLRDTLEGDLGTSGTSFMQIDRHARTYGRSVQYNCLGIQSCSNTDLLFETAHKCHANAIMAEEFHLCGIDPALDFIDEQLRHIEIAYVSICMDVFAAPFAPGVSAPQPLGLFPWHVIAPLQRLVASGKVVAIDVAELSPVHDVGRTTAQLAAQLIFHALHKFSAIGEK
jgi:formiminoglutamase